MTEAKFQQHILDTIDHLRRRKARPDAERIIHALTKKYLLTFGDAKNALAKSVESGAVLRVEYKGNISYRNAAKKHSHSKQRDCNGESLELKASRKFSQLVTHAIAELVLQEPDYLQLGVPALELVKNILSRDSVRYTRKYVNILLDKEVECGGLIKMDNGNYLVGPATNESPKTNTPKESDGAVADGGSVREIDVGSIEIIQVKKRPGPKPGFKREKSEKTYGTTTPEDKNDSNSLRVGGRRKVCAIRFLGKNHHLPDQSPS